MKIKIMAFRDVCKLFVDVWMLYRKYGARRLDDAECEAMTQEADAINEKYQSDLAKDMLVSVIRQVAKDVRMKDGEE
nr:MAG TPA: hypothetical protein [Caudoviricetes sp.]